MGWEGPEGAKSLQSKFGPSDIEFGVFGVFGQFDARSASENLGGLDPAGYPVQEGPGRTDEKSCFLSSPISHLLKALIPAPIYSISNDSGDVVTSALFQTPLFTLSPAGTGVGLRILS